MSTFAYEFLNQLDEQWCEVDLLISEARSAQNQNKEEFYDVLCRSASFLIVAHLEGFVKRAYKMCYKGFKFSGAIQKYACSYKKNLLQKIPRI